VQACSYLSAVLTNLLHEIFTAAFQEELSGLYRDSKRGHPPIPPAQLALATLLQAYTGASDDEVMEATTMDRRWQLVLDCLDTQEPPFSKGTLIAFRKRLIETNMDRRLIERTIEVANQTGGFGARPLRAALDSSPLWGASRVEDTYNLLGHALRGVLSTWRDNQCRKLNSEVSMTSCWSSFRRLCCSHGSFSIECLADSKLFRR